jgi:hypothetical protein
VGDKRSEPRANERHADEIGGYQDEGADQATDQRGPDHPERLIGADGGAREERAEDEAVDAKHDPKDAIARETREQSADEQDDCGGQLERSGEHGPPII